MSSLFLDSYLVLFGVINYYLGLFSSMSLAGGSETGVKDKKENTKM